MDYRISTATFILFAISLPLVTTHLAFADQGQSEFNGKPITQSHEVITATDRDTGLEAASALFVSDSPKSRKKIVHAKCG